jgi:hypothetical protein
MLAAVIPLPSDEVTPPVTKTYFDTAQTSGGFSDVTGSGLPGQTRTTPGVSSTPWCGPGCARCGRRRATWAAGPRGGPRARDVIRPTRDVGHPHNRDGWRPRSCSQWVVKPTDFSDRGSCPTNGLETERRSDHIPTPNGKSVSLVGDPHGRSSARAKPGRVRTVGRDSTAPSERRRGSHRSAGASPRAAT